MSVYVDTSAFLAVLNADDRFHDRARRRWQQLIEAGHSLLCNNYVLVETIAVLQNRLGMDAVIVFQNDVRPILTILWVDENLHQRAVSALLATQRRRLSLVDCASFESMRQAGLRQIFAFDVHFEEQGFDVL
ncbi:MAG: PIN domain-containing protein [Anaerolineales bacterium]|jgi:predicted nucleic acid-binding protein